MSKMSMVIVLGLTLASIFLSYTINRSNVASVGNMSGYYKFSVARNIAHSAVSVALHELELGNDTSAFEGSMMGGRYSVGIIFRGDTADMNSRGMFMDTTYTILLRLYRCAKPFPDPPGAVTLSVNRVGFTMQGNPSVDGYDHDINGGLLPNASPKAGVVALTGSDSTAVAVYMNRITGSPAIEAEPSMPDVMKYVDEYIANADYVYNAGTYGSDATWGSPEEPAIVYCDAGSGTVEFTGAVEGWGILVVKGSLGMAGVSKFDGLVLVCGDGGFTNEVSMGVGGSKIIGAIMMSGAEGSDFEMKGNARVLYSSQALSSAEHMKKLMAYKIISWYE
jgi:hypothetical protein